MLDKAVIDERAVRALFTGIFAAAGASTPNDTMTALSQGRATWHVKKIDTIEKVRSQMPVAYQYVFYAGRDRNTGHELVWEATSVKGEDGGDQASDQYTAALALAALDAGSVGEPWRSLYAHASGDAGRRALGRDIALALREASDQKKSAAAADAAWIQRYIVVGMSRTTAYASLRSYGLVPYNSAYNPGVPIGKNGAMGCDFSDQTAAAWPYHGEPLPKRTSGCAFFKNDPGAFPSVDITLNGAFSMACGSQVPIAISFDDSDRVRSVRISDPEWLCL